MPIVRSNPGEPFHVVCTVCRNDAAANKRRCKFALGQVTTFSQMQLCFWKRHCYHEQHIAACKSQGVDVVLPGHIVKRAVADKIFPVSMFLWGLTCCFTSSSYNDYKKFLASHDVLRSAGSDAADERVGTYAYNKSCQQIVHSVGGVILDDHQGFMRGSVRLAIGADDRDPDRLLRGRAVRPNPTITVKDFNLALIREHGTFPDDAADAVMDGLRDFCTVRRGPQDLNKLTGKGNVIDSALLEHTTNILFQATADGCETEVLGMRQLKVRKLCPRLRFFFRDRPHTSQSIHKAVIRAMKPENKVLLGLLVTDEGSFAKRVRYSRPFRKLWKEEGLAADELDAIYVACDHLAYAEQRFDSRSKPMVRLVKSWTRILRVLARVAADMHEAHRDCRVWAVHLLKTMGGVPGFVRFLEFTVETDYFVSGRCLSQLQDKSNTDISLSMHEVLDILAMREALFYEGRIFSAEQNSSYTWEFLHGARGIDDIYFGSNANKMAWPTQRTQIERPVLFARSLFEMTKAFVTVNYPDYSWRSRFCCFDNSDTRQPEQIRLDAIEAIGKKEGVDAHQCRMQFYEALPIAKKLYAEFGDNKKVWTLIAERQRINKGNRFRADKAPLLQVIFTYLGVMDTTGDLERTFARMCWLTLKHRATQMKLFSLTDALRIATTLPTDIRLYIGASAYQPVQGSTQLQAELRPGTLIHNAQLKCHEFFGTKRCATTLRVPDLGPAKRARHEAAKSTSVARVKLTRDVQPGKKTSERERHNQWVKSAKSMVQDMRTHQHCAEVGMPIPERLTIFGTPFPEKGRMPAKSALQKATLKAIGARVAEAKCDFETDEKNIDYSRSVKAIRADFRRKRLPASAPKFRAAQAALVKVLVSQKLASANRTLPSKNGRQGCRMFLASTPTKASVPSTPSGSTLPMTRPRGDSRSGTQSVTTVWCAPSASVKSSMQWFVNLGPSSSWSLVDNIADAQVVIISASHWPEESANGVAALHCKVYGKLLVSDHHICRPQIVNHVRNFTTAFSKKGERQVKYRLFISAAAKDKHHKMHAELEAYVAKTAGASTRSLYSISVRDGGAADVLAAIKRCQSVFDVKPIRWLVCKSEVRDCTMAISAALGKPPAAIAAHVHTMTQFVEQIGRQMDHT